MDKSQSNGHDKKHPLAGRKQSAATIAKRKLTMATKRAIRTAEAEANYHARKAKTLPTTEKREDARIYLRHAKRIINQHIANGKLKEMDEAHLLALLALKVLEKA